MLYQLHQLHQSAASLCVGQCFHQMLDLCKSAEQNNSILFTWFMLYNCSLGWVSMLCFWYCVCNTMIVHTQGTSVALNTKYSVQVKAAGIYDSFVLGVCWFFSLFKVPGMDTGPRTGCTPSSMLQLLVDASMPLDSCRSVGLPLGPLLHWDIFTSVPYCPRGYDSDMIWKQELWYPW